LIRSCSYFGCSELVNHPDLYGFVFCLEHLAHLEQMIELDFSATIEEPTFNTVAYCLASLNSKACNRQEVIL